MPPASTDAQKYSRTSPSPFQRDVGGLFSLDKGFGEEDAQGETQEVGGPATSES